MYFSIFQYYNDENNNDENNNPENNKEKLDKKNDNYLVEEKTCIICWEISGDIKSLQTISIMKHLRFCKCDGNFHVECLQVWIHKNNRCPICREKLNRQIIPTESSNENGTIPYIIPYILIVLKCVKSLTMCCLLYLGIWFAYYMIYIGVSQPNLYN